MTGLSLPPNPLDVASNALPKNELSIWQVPEAPAPAPVTSAVKLEVPDKVSLDTSAVPSVPARSDVQADQRSTTATQALQQWEATNGQLPAAVRDSIYKNAQGKGASLTVPDYTPGGKSRVGEVDAGIPGYKVIPPDAAGWARDTAMLSNQNAVNAYRNNIRQGLAIGDYGLAGNVLGGIKGYFTDTTQEAAKRTAIQGAITWFNSDEAVDYFNQNPNALPLAKVDPVGFVDSFKKEANIRASRRGEVVNEALSVPPVDLRDGKKSKIDPKFIENSTAVTDKRIIALTNTMDAALQRPQTQQIITLAGQLQVDPAAALAVYGLETSYGATSAESGKGASGPMQVMPDTFKNIKKWFTNPDTIKKYNIPDTTVSAARSMEFNTVNGKITGGLLVLKYNELIGNPKNLWGAGYQGNADAVLQQKRPLNAHDGNIMNADYNRAYVTLYNEALTRLGGGKPVAQAQVQAAAPTKTIVIGDSVAEGFAKANKLEGSYKTGESPKAVYERLQAYVAKNDINGAVVYVGTGLPNNPQQQDFVAKQIALIKEKGGTPYIIGVGPGTQQNPTTGQNEYLSKLATDNQVQFTGPLAAMFPDITKDKMGLHLNDAQSKQLYATTTKKVQVDNTGRTVNRPIETPQVVNQPAPATVTQPAPAAAENKPVAVRDEALNQSARALTMSDEQHNFEVQRIVRDRTVAVQAYERLKANEYMKYQDEYNRLSARREQLATQAEAARRVGNIKNATGFLDQISTLDGEINKAKYNYMTGVGDADVAIQQGIAGIDNNLALAIAYQGAGDIQYRNDPTRLERMWSRFVGYEVRIQPRTDGQFNVWVPVNGKLAPAGVYSKSGLVDEAFGQILPQHRQKQTDAAVALKSKVANAQIDVWKDTQIEVAKTIGALKVEDVKSNTEIIKKRIDVLGYDAPKELAGPNGPVLVAVSKDGMSIMEIDINPSASDKDGKFKREAIRVRPNPARAGLNTANAQ
jgi:hypothetical protein